MRERERFGENPELAIIIPGIDQFRILLFKDLLQKKIGTEPRISGYQFMDDNIYYSILRKIMVVENYKSYLRIIERLKNHEMGRINFDKFEESQMSNLIEISSRILMEDINKFLTKELIRLKSQGANVVDLSSLDSASTTLGAGIIKDKEQRQHVDLLLRKDQDGSKIQLNPDVFLLLIREYRECVGLSFQARDGLLAEKKAEIKELLVRSNKIGGIINKNKDSLGWLSTLRLEENPEIVIDLIKFMHESLHRQDAQTWETLIEKLGDNFKNLIKIIPQTKSVDGLKSDNLITIKSMKSIIKKITNLPDQKNIEQWSKIQRIFNDAIGLDGRLGELSVRASGEASPASLAQRPSSSYENVAKSGPVAGARGGASARLDASKAKGDGEAKR